jgi:hypothetical protein
MKEAKRMKTAAILFSISGLLFIIVGAIGDNIGFFLPVGIALIIVSMSFWQYSRKTTNSEQENSS